MTYDAINRASTICGSKAALARAIGVKPPVIQQWIKGDRPIPTKHCVSIERATSGAVTRKDLRDDWRDHWPELDRDAA